MNKKGYALTKNNKFEIYCNILNLFYKYKRLYWTENNEIGDEIEMEKVEVIISGFRWYDFTENKHSELHRLPSRDASGIVVHDVSLH